MAHRLHDVSCPAGATIIEQDTTADRFFIVVVRSGFRREGLPSPA
jgi:hypothetical protein